MGRFLKRFTTPPEAIHRCPDKLPPIWKRRFFYERQVLFPGTIWQCDCGQLWIVKKSTWRDPSPLDMWVAVADSHSLSKADLEHYPSHVLEGIEGVMDNRKT